MRIGKLHSSHMWAEKMANQQTWMYSTVTSYTYSYEVERKNRPDNLYCTLSTRWGKKEHGGLSLIGLSSVTLSCKECKKNVNCTCSLLIFKLEYKQEASSGTTIASSEWIFVFSMVKGTTNSIFAFSTKKVNTTANSSVKQTIYLHDLLHTKTTRRIKSAKILFFCSIEWFLLD